jgi:hypothetical protein
MLFFSFLPVRMRLPLGLAGFSGVAVAAVASAISFLDQSVVSYQ